MVDADAEAPRSGIRVHLAALPQHLRRPAQTPHRPREEPEIQRVQQSFSLFRCFGLVSKVIHVNELAVQEDERGVGSLQSHRIHASHDLVMVADDVNLHSCAFKGDDRSDRQVERHAATDAN